MSKALFCCAFLTAALAPLYLAHADLIELRNGQKLSGTFSRQGDIVTIKTDDGRIVTAKPDDILKVTLNSTITPDQAAAAEWTRVSAQVRTADDIPTIIDLHKTFLDKFPDAAISAEVRASLGVFQRLVESNAVKFRGRWLPKAQIEVILRDWSDAARPAVEHYKAGRMKEALEAAKSAIDADGQNPDALAVAGLAAYRLNSLGVARSYFTALVSADPGSPLAENNLAIISFQQKQPGEGIAHYGRALQIAPDNRLVLDNIVEALNAYLASGSDKSVSTLKSLQRQFDAAEKRMEAIMAKQGYFRSGSTWMTQEQSDRVAADQKSLQDQYAQLDAQYQAAQNTIARLELQIKQADADYNAALVSILIENDQIVAAQQSNNSNVIFLFASRDLSVQTANRALAFKEQYQLQRDQTIAAARDLSAQGDRLKTAIAAGNNHLTGTQRIMDIGEADNPPIATQP